MPPQYGDAGGNMTCNITVTAGNSSSVSIVIPSVCGDLRSNYVNN